jgi:autophagy-related protein 2
VAFGSANDLLFVHDSVDYFDEAGTDPPNSTPGETYFQQGNKVYQVAAFTARKFYLEGITMYTDEFPSRARTFSRSVMSLSSSSTPDSKVRMKYCCLIIRCKYSLLLQHQVFYATSWTALLNKVG